MRTFICSVIGLVAIVSSTGCTGVTKEGEEAPLELSPWAASYGGSTYGSSIASGPDGDVLLVGGFSDDINFGGGALSADEGIAVFLAHLDKDGNHLFSGSTGYNDTIAAAAIGPDGDLYVGGTYDGAINFGSGKMTGYKNGFVASFDSGGNPVFSRKLGGEAEDWIDDIAIAPDGDLFVTGRVGNDADFGGGAPSLTYTTKEAVVARYDRYGTFLWDVRIPYAVSAPLSVASDLDGNVIVSGQSYTDIEVGTKSANEGAFVAKISGSGAAQWVVSSSSDFGSAPYLNDLVVAPDGTIYAGGMQYYGDFSIGGLDTPFTEEGAAFWLRMSPNGEALAIKSLGIPTYYGPAQLAIAPNGDVLIGLTTYQSVDFGGGVLGSDIGQSAVLGRFTEDGEHIRSMELKGSQDEGITDIAVDPNGNALVLGWFDFDLQIGEDVFTATQGNSMFAARLDF